MVEEGQAFPGRLGRHVCMCMVVFSFVAQWCGEGKACLWEGHACMFVGVVGGRSVSSGIGRRSFPSFLPGRHILHRRDRDRGRQVS